MSKIESSKSVMSRKKIHSPHLLYIHSECASEQVIRQCIADAINNFYGEIRTNFKVAVQQKKIKTEDGSECIINDESAYVWFVHEEISRLLVGLNPDDGSKMYEEIVDPDWGEEPHEDLRYAARKLVEVMEYYITYTDPKSLYCMTTTSEEEIQDQLEYALSILTELDPNEIQSLINDRKYLNPTTKEIRTDWSLISGEDDAQNVPLIHIRDEYKRYYTPPTMKVQRKSPIELPKYIRSEQQKRDMVILAKSKGENLKISDISDEGEFTCSMGYSYPLFYGLDPKVLMCTEKPDNIEWNQINPNEVFSSFLPFCRNGNKPNVKINNGIIVYFNSIEETSLASLINYHCNFTVNKQIIRFRFKGKPNNKNKYSKRGRK